MCFSPEIKESLKHHSSVNSSAWSSHYTQKEVQNIETHGTLWPVPCTGRRHTAVTAIRRRCQDVIFLPRRCSNTDTCWCRKSRARGTSGKTAGFTLCWQPASFGKTRGGPDLSSDAARYPAPGCDGDDAVAFQPGHTFCTARGPSMWLKKNHKDSPNVGLLHCMQLDRQLFCSCHGRIIVKLKVRRRCGGSILTINCPRGAGFAASGKRNIFPDSSPGWFKLKTASSHWKSARVKETKSLVNTKKFNYNSVRYPWPQEHLETGMEKHEGKALWRKEMTIEKRKGKRSDSDVSDAVSTLFSVVMGAAQTTEATARVDQSAQPRKISKNRNDAIPTHLHLDWLDRAFEVCMNFLSIGEDRFWCACFVCVLLSDTRHI